MKKFIASTGLATILLLCAVICQAQSKRDSLNVDFLKKAMYYTFDGELQGSMKRNFTDSAVQWYLVYRRNNSPAYALDSTISKIHLELKKLDE